MQATSIGTVFEDLIRALNKADPDQLAFIAAQSQEPLAENIAYFQKAIGLFLAHTYKDQGGHLSDLGWLVVALAELSLSWCGLTSNTAATTREAPSTS